MRIGLVDVDRTNFPNLVLMKLSTHYKRQGYDTSLYYPPDVLEGLNLFEACEEYIGASVFTRNFDTVKALRAAGVHVAGSGTDSKEILPDEIEHLMPDYDLYGVKNVAYGYLTRGCPRGCPFCIVASKEGRQSHKVADLSEFWNGQATIKLLDPNLLACQESNSLLKQLVESGASVDFTQGLDVRLLDDVKIDLLNNIKLSIIHFAWDNPRDERTKENLAKFAKRRKWKSYRKYAVYVLCNYWSTIEEDLARIYWLRDNGYNPYVMVYDKDNAPHRVRELQRWVNNRRIFNTCPRFEDYRR